MLVPEDECLHLPLQKQSWAWELGGICRNLCLLCNCSVWVQCSCPAQGWRHQRSQVSSGWKPAQRRGRAQGWQALIPFLLLWPRQGHVPPLMQGNPFGAAGSNGICVRADPSSIFIQILWQDRCRGCWENGSWLGQYSLGRITWKNIWEICWNGRFL